MKNVIEISYHRNGVAGEGFFVALVADDEIADGAGPLVVVVPEWAVDDPSRSPAGGVPCYAISPTIAAEKGVAFGTNSWRGDRFYDVVAEAARRYRDGDPVAPTADDEPGVRYERLRGEDAPAEDDQPPPTACFMGCEPTEADQQGERFFVIVMEELTIYGHTVGRWTRENYPEDEAATRRVEENGLVFGCWHSGLCPDGELGSNDSRGALPIGYQAFALAREHGWPKLDVPVTQPGPVTALGVIDEHGEYQLTWDSLHGDYDEARR